MVRLSTISTLALTIACSLGSAQALSTITIKCTKFFDSVTKDQFFIKGVVHRPYQPRSISGNIDPLAKPDDSSWRIRVDPSQNHDECMQSLENSSINLLLDLVSSICSIVRNNTEYDINIWNNVRRTVDASEGCSNILGLFVSNEATNDNKTTVACDYVMHLLSDTKNCTISTAPQFERNTVSPRTFPEVKSIFEHELAINSIVTRLRLHDALFELCSFGSGSSNDREPRSAAMELPYTYNLYHANASKKAAATYSFNGMVKLSTSDQGCSSFNDTVTPNSGSRLGNGGNSTFISKTS
ncbi:hypothetical protein BGX21_006893 [Mortierella sp. AD011]|nr:hypothetical protein BGX21_006893 [Mortierella sp. AD011]